MQSGKRKRKRPEPQTLIRNMEIKSKSTYIDFFNIEK